MPFWMRTTSGKLKPLEVRPSLSESRVAVPMTARQLGVSPKSTGMVRTSSMLTVQPSPPKPGDRECESPNGYGPPFSLPTGSGVSVVLGEVSVVPSDV